MKLFKNEHLVMFDDLGNNLIAVDEGPTACLPECKDSPKESETLKELRQLSLSATLLEAIGFVDYYKRGVYTFISSKRKDLIFEVLPAKRKGNADTIGFYRISRKPRIRYTAHLSTLGDLQDWITSKGSKLDIPIDEIKKLIYSSTLTEGMLTYKHKQPVGALTL